jgi:hypothetical protein
MGAYIYTLKGPKHCIKVNINGNVESVSLLSFNYKPISTWDGEPRWQILAKARCERMKNVWLNHGGMPKYACEVFIENDGTIDFINTQVFEWPYKNDASICDYSGAYQKRVHVGNLKHKYHGVWELQPTP